MSFSIRDGCDVRGRLFPPHEIGKQVADMDMGPWISSLVLKALQNAQFATDDFMGKVDAYVSIPELIQATAYYATVMGYSPSWESAPSPNFDEFERRSCVYKAVMKKVDNWSTRKGQKKLAAVRKAIRVSVTDKMTSVCGRRDPLGVFGQTDDDVASIYRDTDPKKIVCKLHRLGKYAERDPRYYIHMVYRYYMNEFHKQLAAADKVLRFPRLQKVMDIKLSVGCTGSIPPEFRMYMQDAKGDITKAATLPVPSKTNSETVVYGYEFESAVPWVPVMRAKIFDMFVELSPYNSPHRFREIYPKYLVKGDEGCDQGRKRVAETLAQSIEISGLVQTLHRIESLPEGKGVVLDKVLLTDSRVADVFARYNNHPFREEGEQLRERIGFFLQESVRGIFRHIASTMPSFCNDIYTSLNIPFRTIEVFEEFCCKKSPPMKYQKTAEKVWRDFVLDVHKICCVTHAWSRRQEVKTFVEEHGSTDGYMRRVLNELE